MRRLVGPLIIACLVLAGCQRSDQTSEGTGGASIDGLQYNGVFYARWTAVTTHPKGVRPIGPADLGRVVGQVKANRADELVESAAPFGDLEATFLPVGTPVHAVKGYPTSFRLAARSDGGLALYEPWSSPTAQVGADLLGGIQGKVRRIGVYSHHEPLRLLGLVEGRSQVQRLVRLVLRAPVAEQDPAGTAQDYEPYVVSFHLRDGTATSRLFNAKTGFMGGGILLPDEFTAAIRQAIARHRGTTAP
jgi:hypothetical protein